MSTSRRNHTVSAVAWFVIGSILSFGVLALPSIGLFVLALGIPAAVWLGQHRLSVVNIAWALLGASAVVLAIGVANLGNTACPSSGSGTAIAGKSYSCGGLSATPFLVSGAVLLALGLAAFGYASKNGPSRG